jgi:molybdenum cofactor cytidylyltransferase
VVVTGADGQELDAVIAWRDEIRVVNPAPERGLASSVRLGFAALRDADVDLDAALVLLGDQPRVAPDVIAALLAAPATEGRPAVLPRYRDGTNPNPVLLLRSAWPLVETLAGDRGLVQVLRARPELVIDVEVAGSNPDIDTPADLAAL